MKLKQQKGSKHPHKYTHRVNKIQPVINPSIGTVSVYTDGSSMQNGFGGPGTWAFIVVSENEIIYEESGYEKSTTNNRMEITACMKAVEYISKNIQDLQVVIHMDSSYVHNSCIQWIDGWHNKNYKRTGEDIPNADLWKLMYPLIKSAQNIQYIWVKGHADNEFNNRADELCTETYQTKADAGWKPMIQIPQEIDDAQACIGNKQQGEVREFPASTVKKVYGKHTDEEHLKALHAEQPEDWDASKAFTMTPAAEYKPFISREEGGKLRSSGLSARTAQMELQTQLAEVTKDLVEAEKILEEVLHELQQPMIASTYLKTRITEYLNKKS